MNSLSHNKIVCLIALVATITFSLGTCSGYLFAADVTEVMEEEVVVEEAPSRVEAEESTTAEAVPAEEPASEGETPAGEEDGFWDGPWPWILGGAVVVGGGVAIAVAASSGGGGGGDDDYNVVGSWSLSYSWTGGGSGTSTWYLNSGNTFTTSTGYHGTWSVSGSSITVTYSNGTTYTGTIHSSTSMSGTMIDYSGYTGTWSATKIGGSFISPPRSGVNMSGEKTSDDAGVAH